MELELPVVLRATQMSGPPSIATSQNDIIMSVTPVLRIEFLEKTLHLLWETLCRLFSFMTLLVNNTGEQSENMGILEREFMVRTYVRTV